MRRSTWISLTLLATGSACNASKFNAGDDVDAADGSTGDDTGAGDGAGDDGVDATHWKLDGALLLTGGEVVVGESILEITQVSDDHQLLACAGVAPVWLVESAEELPDEALVTWWDLTVGEFQVECDETKDFAWSSPLADDKILLGVGSLDPEIVAVLGALDGLGAGAESTLNGAYASLDDGRNVVVFGAFGPSDAYQGLGARATEAPLADGTWYVRGLYAFSY